MNDDTPAISSAAYPPLAKALAAVWLAALGAWGVRAWLATGSADWSAVTWLVVALLLVSALASFYWIVRSRTWIEGERLRQSWLWQTKDITLAEITRLKLIHVPYLGWLIAPRLVVKTSTRGTLVFPAADVRVLVRFVHTNAALS